MPEKPSMLMPALYGGIIMGFLVGVPYVNYINICCCAGVLAGGFLSVFFYKKDLTRDMPPLESSDGLKLGAIAGSIGGVIATVISQVIQVVSGVDAKEGIQKSIEVMSSRQGSEGIISIMEGIATFMDSPLFFLAHLIFLVILCTIFGLLGGLIGYSILKPKPELMNVQPPPPPPQL